MVAAHDQSFRSENIGPLLFGLAIIPVMEGSIQAPPVEFLIGKE